MLSVKRRKKKDKGVVRREDGNIQEAFENLSKCARRVQW